MKIEIGDRVKIVKALDDDAMGFVGKKGTVVSIGEPYPGIADPVRLKVDGLSEGSDKNNWFRNFDKKELSKI